MKAMRRGMSRLLVIDDDNVIRQLLRVHLEDAGYEVLEAPNGRIGIELCNHYQFDVVITDIVMPDRAGIATIVALREQFPNTKIIAISGGGGSLGTKDYLQTAAHFGALRTFAKPFTTQQLLTALQEML